MPLHVVILAAGESRRMRSNRPKPLVELAGKPLILRALDAVRPLGARSLAVVVNPRDSQTPQRLRQIPNLRPAPVFPVQPTPRGTAHAAAQALPQMPNTGAVLVLFADTPMLQTAQLRKLTRNPNALSLLTFHPENPRGYGRIIRNKQNQIVDIAEERDADNNARKIPEAFSGALCAPTRWLKKALPRIRPLKKGGEVYLTRLPALAVRDGIPIAAVRCPPEDAMGVNTPADLARAEAVWRKREAEKLLARGVRLADPLRVDIRGTVRPARDAFIDANVLLAGEIVLGENCSIGQNCALENCVIGKNAVVHPFCHLRGVRIGANCEIGPFARLRPGAVLDEGAKIGNFVEVKNANIGAEVKAGHLSYLGDADIGARANIGAGTVTCNFDGKKKNRTRIGADAFIGSGTQLVAPVEVGAGAYAAAGSTITRNVTPGALVFARARQSEKTRRQRK